MGNYDPYANGVLTPDEHGRLVANLDHYARDAGVLPYWIWARVSEYCGPEETEYLRKFRFAQHEGKAGLVFVGEDNKGEVLWRMSAMTGALVRNFIRARVQQLGSVLDDIASKDMPQLTALMIPNFFISEKRGGATARWQVASLFDMLQDRHSKAQQTVLYVEDLAKLEKEYGAAFARLIENHYRVVRL